MITSFLREKIRKRKNCKADVKLINNSDRNFFFNLSFGRYFGHGILLVTINIKDFEFC